MVRLVTLIVALASLAIAVILAGDEQRPYVVTAIDYHFHDAHPTFPIAPGRDLVINNAGGNLHNVTIPALDYSKNLEPNEQIVIEDVASRFDRPGRYSFVCLLHQDRGMAGTIVVTDA